VALNNGIHNETRNDVKHDLTWVAGESNSPLGTRSASSASDSLVGPPLLSSGALRSSSC
jgi:hypothetical protein